MTSQQRKLRIDKALKCELKGDGPTYGIEEVDTSTTRLSIKSADANIHHLQPQRIQGLWKKAEEILSTPGLILNAAGNKLARQVADVGVSSAKGVTPPHFVYSKKSGPGMEVRCDCSVFKSTPNICEHSLATAENMGTLKEYLNWVRKTKAKGLNLSVLIAKEVPTSSGKKGSTSRRKGIPKGKKKEVRMERSGINTEPASPPPLPPPLSSCSSPPDLSFVKSSMQYDNLTSPIPPYPLPFDFTCPYPPHFSSTTLFPPAQGTYGSSHSYPHCYTSNFWPGSSTSSPTILQSSDVPKFSLKRLDGTRIRSCYGCGNPIRTNLSYIPPPPHDVVIAYKERRYYKDPSTHEMRLTPSDENTYYHLMVKCVQLKHPAFLGSMLVVDPATRVSLQQIHRTHLQEQFGFYI